MEELDENTKVGNQQAEERLDINFSWQNLERKDRAAREGTLY
jgi:hypothetical protein